MRSLSRVLALVSLTCVALAPAAHAQTAPTVASGEAEQRRTALYQEGVTLANAGRWGEAVDRFRRVVAIRSAPAALFTLGQAEEHNSALASAERTYERALAEARSSGIHDVEAAAQKALANVEPRVPRVIVKVTPASASASTTVDGDPVPSGAVVKLDPGDHVVAVRASGMRPFDAKVHLVEGQSLDVSAALEPEAAAAASAPAAPAAPPIAPAPPPPVVDVTPSRPFPVGPVVLGGAGIVAAVIGVVVRQSGQGDYDSASASCVGGACRSASDVSAGNSARSQIITGDVVLGVGVAAVAAAGVWWVVSPPRSRASNVSVGVLPGAGGGRLVMQGSF